MRRSRVRHSRAIRSRRSIARIRSGGRPSLRRPFDVGDYYFRRLVEQTVVVRHAWRPWQDTYVVKPDRRTSVRTPSTACSINLASFDRRYCVEERSIRPENPRTSVALWRHRFGRIAQEMKTCVFCDHASAKIAIITGLTIADQKNTLVKQFVYRQGLTIMFVKCS